MLIISKFHDYYDTASGLGIDKTIQYKRTEEKFVKQNLELNISRIYQDGKTLYQSKTYPETYYELIIVGFCGKTYVGYEILTVTKPKYNTFNPVEEITYLYGEEAMDFVLSKHNLKKDKEVKNHINELLFKYHNKPNFNELFFKYNTPIFVMKDIEGYNWWSNGKATATQITYNAKLKNYEFVKVFDPFTAFQEIQMYVGGVLGGTEKDITVIAEKYRKSQQGMDKWSFRNPDPPKRKQKK